ncbi:MAG: hypothetical protein QGG36_08610 [Pirellulaceae bacterium]|jgi:hypothetical protein|nr:hypothetical protein [Pirellulaceae bacterium]MDP7015847.1 hypothetical protein [Pirellulaceae bacterium]
MHDFQFTLRSMSLMACGSSVYIAAMGGAFGSNIRQCMAMLSLMFAILFVVVVLHAIMFAVIVAPPAAALWFWRTATTGFRQQSVEPDLQD